jgi:hypothetical protein
MTQIDRRSFLAAGLGGAALRAEPAHPADEQVDLPTLIARADLHYDKPLDRSEEGMPIGNGRMGTLVWTTPTQLRFQMNRVDVYANNSATVSFFERHNDYCGGCGFLDLEFATGGGDPFPSTGFPPHLSVYDGALPYLVQKCHGAARIRGTTHASLRYEIFRRTARAIRSGARRSHSDAQSHCSLAA